MSYDFDNPPPRRTSDCIKWNKYEGDVLPLWVADMDFRSPEAVMHALHERVEHGVFGYPLGGHGDHAELDRLCEVIRERLYERYGWEVAPEALQFLPGVIPGLNLACHAAGGEAGAVLVQPPVYTPILGAPKNAGLQIQEAVLTHNGDGTYSVDLEAFEAAITDDTRLFILCNPHNPVGRVFSQEELLRMAEICARHQVVICSDEIHCDLIFPPHRHTPIASLDEEIAHNTITLMSPSKAYNLAGLRLAFAIIPHAELRRRFHAAQKDLVGGLNTMGIVAALAAYRDGDAWLRQVLTYLEENREYLFDYVSAKLPGVKMVEPQGTYLAWLDCREAGITGKSCDFFLEQARVGLVEGESFGSGGEGFVRLNFACSRSLLHEALERMRLSLERLSV